jgi:hypothetical protein
LEGKNTLRLYLKQNQYQLSKISFQTRERTSVHFFSIARDIAKESTKRKEGKKTLCEI